MIEKIEKISRIKAIDFDVGKKFDSGTNGDSGFAATLKRAIDKRNKPAGVSDAYSLDLSSFGGEALYYFGATDLRALLS